MAHLRCELSVQDTFIRYVTDFQPPAKEVDEEYLVIIRKPSVITTVLVIRSRWLGGNSPRWYERIVVIFEQGTTPSRLTAQLTGRRGGWNAPVIRGRVATLTRSSALARGCTETL